MNGLRLGQIVRSKAGRDKNRFFIIVGFPAEHDDSVYLADGDLRRIEHPKLKKIKHIAKTNQSDAIISEKLNNSDRISDHDIKKVLESFNSVL